MLYEYECPQGHTIEAHVRLNGEGTPTACTELVPQGVLLTQAEFDALLEYSATIPTGKTPGKQWKARRGERWVRGEYGKPIGDEIEIHWLPIYVAPAVLPPPGPCGASPLKKLISLGSAYFPGAGSWRGA